MSFEWMRKLFKPGPAAQLGPSFTIEHTESKVVDVSGTPLGDEIKKLLEERGVSPTQGGTVELTGAEAEALSDEIRAALAKAPSSQPAAPSDPVAQLERLAKLREEGAITAEEFDSLKKKLLGGL
jgi:hypothetical protein